MDSIKVDRMLLVLILVVSLAILLKSDAPGATAWAVEEAEEEAAAVSTEPLPAGLSFAVDGSTFFIMNPQDNRIYTYNRQGRLGKVYTLTTLADDMEVRTGVSSY